MKLEEIGFYTLSQYRASRASVQTDLWRCEIILTDRCNFKCPYCRGVREDCRGTMDYKIAQKVIMAWSLAGLKNIRFSGGEPTLVQFVLNNMVALSKSMGMEHIAISTNGSSSMDIYEGLIKSGVNDISVSLDACCSSTGKTMTGGIEGMWETVTANIAKLSKMTYVTVGIVLTEDNLAEAEKTIKLAHDLGVADIRIIPAAQFGNSLAKINIPDDILEAHKILKYRIENARKGNPIRGLRPTDFNRCPLVLDDMAVAGGCGHGGPHHYPCIIYFREGGAPIGEFDACDIKAVRQARKKWAETHDCSKDPICSKNCLDVCVEYNNTWYERRLAGSG